MKLNPHLILSILTNNSPALAADFTPDGNDILDFQRASNIKYPYPYPEEQSATIQVENNIIKSKIGPIEDAKFMFDVASLAYCPETKIKEYNGIYRQKLTENFKPLEVITNNQYEMQAYVASHSERNELMVVFRGSVNRKNWEMNLNAWQVPLNIKEYIWVHSGFLSILNAIESDLLNYLNSLLKQKQYQNYSVVFAGHSLGGSVATLATAKLPPKLNLPWERVKLFTYGSPRVGNRYFVDFINSKPIETTRVVNNNDPVPKLPNINYYHIHNELFIRGQETIICQTSSYEDAACSRSLPFTINPDAHNTAWDTTKTLDHC